MQNYSQNATCYMKWYKNISDSEWCNKSFTQKWIMNEIGK